MSKISDAADAVKQFAAQHQAIFDVAVILGEIGSIEQAAAEAKLACAKARDELNAVSAELAAARDDLGMTKLEIEGIAAAANNAAKEIVEKAKYEAEAIVVAARADAQNLREVAEKDAASLRASASEAVVAANTRIAEAHDVLADINHEVAQSKTALAQTQAAIDELKEKAKNLLG